jgi:hypothetical protein
LLAAVEARRDHHLASAKAAVRDRHFEDALEELTKAERLRAGPDTRQVRACACLLAGDFPGALAEHGAATRL